MTERQLRFVEEFIATGNASEAARRAGYAERYSNRMGTRLLNQINIRAAIDERLQAVKTSKTIKQQELLEFSPNIRTYNFFASKSLGCLLDYVMLKSHKKNSLYLKG